MSQSAATVSVERVQTGVRMEKRILKVLKAVAEYHEISLGDLLEGIVLHAFEGKQPFGPEGLGRIRELRRIYGLDLDATPIDIAVLTERLGRRLRVYSISSDGTTVRDISSGTMPILAGAPGDQGAPMAVRDQR